MSFVELERLLDVPGTSAAELLGLILICFQNKHTSYLNASFGLWKVVRAIHACGL